MSEDLGTGFLAECFSMGVEAFVDWYDHLPARRVMYIIKNSTKETLYRTAYIPNHGAWVEDGPWVFPWETIPPGATLKCCLQLSGGHLDLQGKIAYKRAKDSDDLFRVHIKCPEHGPNEYFDTSLSEWANKEYYFKEMTPFRQNILGTASRQVTAAFLLGGKVHIVLVRRN